MKPLKSQFSKATLAIAAALLISTSANAIMDSQVSDEWLDEAAETQEMVKLYDRNNDQLLSSQEIQQGITQDFQPYDSNRDNQLSLNEFETLWATELDQSITKEFRSIDTNNDQELSADELVVNYKQMEKQLFHSSCLFDDPAMEQEFANEAKQEINELDTNRNGRLDYTEFSKTQRQHMVEDFQDIDIDKNGQLTTKEYREALEDLAQAAKELKRELPVRCAL